MEHKDQKAEEKTIMEHPLGIPEMPFLHREVSAMRLQGAIAALICLFPLCRAAAEIVFMS